MPGTDSVHPRPWSCLRADPSSAAVRHRPIGPWFAGSAQGKDAGETTQRLGAVLVRAARPSLLSGIFVSAAALTLTGLTAGSASAAPPPLAVGAERAVATARPGAIQGEPAAAWNGSEYYVVWDERPASGPVQVYGARVSANGTVLDPGGVQLSQSLFDDSLHPRVTSGAGKFVVVWEDAPEGDYSDVGAAMVRADGTVQKRWFMGGDNGQTHPDVAWNGQLFLAVWQDEPDPSNEDVYGARITANGLTLDGCSSDSCPNGDDTGIPIATNPGDEVLPAVAANSGLFLVAWTDRTDPSHPLVRDTAVAINGLSMDQAGFDLSQDPGNQSQVALARNAGTALFAWADLRSGTSSDVFATTMKPGTEQGYTPTPVPAAGFAVSSAAGDQTDPAVARRGGSYLVAWTDTRNGTSDVYAARVGSAGVVFDPAGVPVAAGPRTEHAAALASAGAKVLVVYAHDVLGSTFGGRDRVFIRVIS